MRKGDKTYLFDTSAIFAFTDNEQGAQQVEKLLQDAAKQKLAIYFSAMSVMEAYSVTAQELGQESANQIVSMLRSLPVTELPLSDDLVLIAGDYKARHHISVADAWIAATAKVHHLTLLHKDPEFEPLKEELDLQELPYKRK